MNTKKMNHSIKKGFTLIELLIVVAILGAVAGVMLMLINPADQFARSRDANRKTVGAQLQKALLAYYTSHSRFPNQSGNWIDDLANAGEIKRIPPAIPYSTGFNGGPACTNVFNTSIQNGYCYRSVAPFSDAVLLFPIESKNQQSKCGTGNFFAYWYTNMSDVFQLCVSPTSGAGGSFPLFFVPYD